jgi:PPM family protein phosphatase
MEIFPSHAIHDLSIAAQTEHHQGVISRFKQHIFKQPDPHLAVNPKRGSRSRPLGLTVAQRTDVGRKRQHNEDSVAYIIPKDQQLLESKGALFIVADGMGGHAAGEVASEIAVDTVCTLYYQDADTDIPLSLRRAIQYANATIYQRATENAQHSGMGTTCVAAVLRGTTAYIANVGDSRAYLVRKGHVRQISQDHSWVAEQVRMGQMTVEEAQLHSMRNIITRSLGPFPEVEVDVFVEQVEEGDAFVLCSDGLSGMISDDEITNIVEHFGPQESVYRLVEYANAQGGMDNITAIVARVNQR